MFRFRIKHKRRPCLRCGRRVWSLPTQRLCMSCRIENGHMGRRALPLTLAEFTQ